MNIFLSLIILSFIASNSYAVSLSPLTLDPVPNGSNVTTSLSWNGGFYPETNIVKVTGSAFSIPNATALFNTYTELSSSLTYPLDVVVWDTENQWFAFHTALYNSDRTWTLTEHVYYGSITSETNVINNQASLLESIFNMIVSSPVTPVTLDAINSKIDSLGSSLSSLSSQVANMDPLTITQSISFLLGSFSALAFVVSVNSRLT